MEKFNEVNKKIEEAVVEGYKKIENGVVKGYKKVEGAAVEGYKKVEGKFIDALFSKVGETTEETRERLKSGLKKEDDKE